MVGPEEIGFDSHDEESPHSKYRSFPDCLKAARRGKRNHH
jgi:hypothetical protein